MESLYARDTPTAQERKLKLAERNQVIEDGQVTLKPQNPSNDEHPSETLDSLIETSTESNANTGAGNAATSTANSTDDTFGFNFSSLPREELEDQWRASQGTEDEKNPPEDDKKTEEARLAELSGELGSHSASNSEKTETKAPETSQAEEAPAVSTASEPNQPRRAGVASVPRKAKPAITINTGSGSTGLEEQNPRFFRAYSLQLQLKEQIIAFNYLQHESIIRKSSISSVFSGYHRYTYDVTSDQYGHKNFPTDTNSFC
ncbi:hypothetical protein JG687_00000508 [Phytophthora cactorum]|uniref:Uncharacterized protein n=1 Tax=Phytophthora cactorum TaxID=29920 RepID=A0A8T1UZX9_9STRA|nr:hypothetical protein JG687_00000508 [Phytophthora cactorum]